MVKRGACLLLLSVFAGCFGSSVASLRDGSSTRCAAYEPDWSHDLKPQETPDGVLEIVFYPEHRFCWWLDGADHFGGDCGQWQTIQGGVRLSPCPRRQEFSWPSLYSVSSVKTVDQAPTRSRLRRRVA